MQPRFGSSLHHLSEIKTSLTHGVLVSELDESKLVELLDDTPNTDAEYLAKHTLTSTELQFKEISQTNATGLALSPLTFVTQFSIMAEEYNHQPYYHFYLDQLPNIAEGYQFINQHGEVVAKVFVNQDATINIIAYAPIIIENTNPVQNVKISSNFPVLISSYLSTQQLSIHAASIHSKDTVEIDATKTVLYAYQECELVGKIFAGELCIIKAGTYRGKANIYANSAVIITEESNQYNKIFVQDKFAAVGLKIHEHPGSHIQAPNGLKIVAGDYQNQGILVSDDFSLLHVTGKLEGHYYFAKSSRIDTNRSIKASKSTQFFINGKLEEHAALCARFVGQIKYCPNMVITAEEVNLGVDRVDLPAKESKGEILIKAGMKAEVGKLDLLDASLHVEAGYWVSALGEIQSYSKQTDCVLHFDGKSISLENNITSNATLLLSKAEKISLKEGCQFEVGSFLVDAPKAKLEIPRYTSLTIHKDMLVTAKVYRNLGKVKAEKSVKVVANKRIINRGSIDSPSQNYVAPWIFSSGGLTYQNLQSAAFASFFGGFNFTGSANHLGLATFSLQFNLQTKLAKPNWSQIAVTATSLGISSLYFFATPAVASTAQFAFSAVLRGSMLVATFGSTFESAKQLYQDPSTPNYVLFIAHLTKTGLLAASTGLAAYSGYHATAVSETTTTPKFDFITFAKAELPSILGAFTGDNNYALINVNLGAGAVVSDTSYNLFEFNAQALASLTQSHTSILNFSSVKNYTVLGSTHTAYVQAIYGDIKTLWGNNIVRANEVFFLDRRSYEYKRWSITADHLHTYAKLTGFTDSNLKIKELVEEGKVYINHSQIDIGQVDDKQGLQIVNSVGKVNVSVSDGAFLNVSKSNVAMKVLDVAEKGAVEVMASATKIETLKNAGTLSTELSTLTGKDLQNSGNITSNDSAIGYEKMHGDFSPQAFSATNTVLYTPDNINLMTPEEKHLLDQLVFYCATHHAYPTADQWFAVLGRKPTAEESKKYNDIMMHDAFLQSQDRALRDNEFQMVLAQNPKIAEGKPNLYQSQHIAAVRDQLFSAVPVVEGAKLVRTNITDQIIKDFFTDKPKVSASFTFNEILYSYDKAILRKNKSTYNCVPVSYIAPDATLTGTYHANGPTVYLALHDVNVEGVTGYVDGTAQFLAKNNVNFEHSNIVSKYGMTVYAENKVIAKASHLKGSTLDVVGIKGVDAEAEIKYSTSKNKHFQFHGLNSGTVTEKTTTASVEENSFESSQGDVNVSSTKGEVYFYGNKIISAHESSIYGYGDVKLYDVRGQEEHTIKKTTLWNKTYTSIEATLSSPSSLINRGDVHIRSETGNIDGVSAEINSDGIVYASAPNGDVLLSRPVLDDEVSMTQTGLLGMSNPLLSSSDWYSLTSAALSPNRLSDLASVNLSFGKRTQTYRTQHLGRGGITARGLVIDSKTVHFQNNFELNLPHVKIHASAGVYMNGARLDSSIDASESTFNIGVNLLTAQLSSLPYSHASATSSQSVYVPYIPNVGTWEIDTPILNLESTYIAPEKITGHVDTLTLHSPINTNESISKSMSIGPSSVAYFKSETQHEFISFKTGINPTDASQFKVDKVITTDAEIGKAIKADQMVEHHQTLHNESDRVGLSMMADAKGLAKIQLTYHNLDLTIPVDLINNVLGKMPAEKAPLSKKQAITQIEEVQDDDYHDYESEAPKSPSSKPKRAEQSPLAQHSLFKPKEAKSAIPEILAPVKSLSDYIYDAMPSYLESDYSDEEKELEENPFNEALLETGQSMRDYIEEDSSSLRSLQDYIEEDESSLRYAALTPLGKYVAGHLYGGIAMFGFWSGYDEDIKKNVSVATALSNNAIKQAALFGTTEIFGIYTLPFDLSSIIFKASADRVNEVAIYQLNSNLDAIARNNSNRYLENLGLYRYQSNLFNTLGMNLATQNVLETYDDFRKASVLRVPN